MVIFVPSALRGFFLIYSFTWALKEIIHLCTMQMVFTHMIYAYDVLHALAKKYMICALMFN